MKPKHLDAAVSVGSNWVMITDANCPLPGSECCLYTWINRIHRVCEWFEGRPAMAANQPYKAQCACQHPSRIPDAPKAAL
jgi:hypothetical protein